MYKKISFFIAILMLITALSSNVFGDVRKENIELYLVIDKSKSMVEEISDVSSYINNVFIDNFLIPGDRLVLIQFYGHADLVYDGIITDSGKRLIMDDISGIPADGRFTDIGNALDRLDKAVNSAGQRYERKYLILLTDGKQEAPPESPYYTPDGSFNHVFLENTKTIQKEGWKIMILGIGNDTAVRELAEELATTYEIIDFQDTIPAAKSSSELIGRILSDEFMIEGNQASITLRSEGYSDERTIVIEQLAYQLYSGNYPLIDQAVTLVIGPDAEKTFKIELSDELLDKIENDGRNGSIIFKFSGDTPFLPAVFDSVIISRGSLTSEGKVKENSENNRNNNFNWLIMIIIVLVAAAVAVFIVIRNIILHRDDDETKKRKENTISGDS